METDAETVSAILSAGGELPKGVTTFTGTALIRSLDADLSPA